MKSTFWRAWMSHTAYMLWLFVTYILYVAFSTSTGTGTRLALAFLWTAIGLALICAYQQSRVWTHDGVMSRVQNVLGFRPEPTIDNCKITDLPKGCCGWTSTSSVTYRNACLTVISDLSSVRRVPPTYAKNGLVLVIRSYDGHLHLFRFGKYQVLSSPARNAVATKRRLAITDHGKLGPHRFAAKWFSM